MKRAIGSPTKAQKAYQDAARALGCMVCRYRIKAGMQRPGTSCGPVEIHHRNKGDYHGAKQLGQHAVVALGLWHHRGVPKGMAPSVMREIFGPSFALHARDFREWTADVLPGMGRGTEAWQAYQDQQLAQESGA